MRTETETKDDALIEQWIVSDSLGRGVEEARLAEHGVPVWALIADLHRAGLSPDDLARDYEIPLGAVHATQVYYQRHQAAFDARLAANDAPVIG